MESKKKCVPLCLSLFLLVTVGKEQHGFIDLEMLPPELGITILSYLNATDLCLAGCVWQDLGNDEYLWQGYEGSPLDFFCGKSKFIIN